MTKNVQERLTKDFAFKNNIDPTGRKWGIGKVVGTALYHIDVVDGPAVGSKPKDLNSKYTNPTLAQKAIEKYLADMWDYSEKKEQKLVRQEHRDKALADDVVE